MDEYFRVSSIERFDVCVMDNLINLIATMDLILLTNEAVRFWRLDSEGARV